MSILREYIITLHSFEDLEAFYNDMETPGGPLHIPNRAVDISKRRPLSRNTHYLLSDEEAQLIRNDTRVSDVTLSFKESGMVVRRSYVDNSDLWSKGPSIASGYKNWGILRVREGQTRPNWGADGDQVASGSVEIPYNGENVDIVIVDGFIDPTHPEFALNPDGSGGSKVVQFNWLTYNQQITGNPTNTYVYGPYSGPYISESDKANNNHGTQVAGIAAGNTQGWARKSKIYNICPYGYDLSNTAAGVSVENIIDIVRLWHSDKPVNPETGSKDPTVLNLSFAAGVFVDINSISQVSYRGNTYTGPFSQNDFANWSANIYYSNSPTSIYIPQPYAPIESDMADAIADGIIIVGAAGNSSDKITRDPADIDYNNCIVTTSGIFYFNRGTMTAANDVICVGAANDAVIEQKAWFSSTGPRVDVYAPGVNIVGPTNSSSGTGVIPDLRNPFYGVRKGSGTSYASPQVSGVIASILSQIPFVNQDYIKQYLKDTAKLNSLSVDTNGGGVLDLTALQGGGNNYLAASYSNMVLTTHFTSPLLTKVGVELLPFQPVTVTGSVGALLYETTASLPYDFYYDPVIGFLVGSAKTAGVTTTAFNITDSVSTVQSGYLTIIAYDDLSSTLITPVVTATFSMMLTPTLIMSSSGGYGTYHYTISPELPAGLVFDSVTSQISGTPYDLVYQAVFTVSVTDEVGQTSSQTIQLSVLPPGFNTTLVITSATLTVDLPVSPIFPISVISAYGDITFSISPPLPPGLTFDSTTAGIAGTPLVASPLTPYTITATDEFQRSSTNTLQIAIAGINTTYNFVEGVYANVVLAPFSQDVKFSFISGKLPPGMELVDDRYLVGIPEYVSITSTYQFVLRASVGGTFIFDRLFTTTVAGSDNITWITPVGHLQVGILGEFYAINNQWVDFNFVAFASESPSTTTIKFYIPENGGTLPPGLQLDKSGRLSGFIQDNLSDLDVLINGGYDENVYAVGVPKIYQFSVAATDNIAQYVRNFKIMVVTPEMVVNPNSTDFNFDYTILQTNTNYLPPLQFITGSDLGTISAENNDDINVSAYDPYPTVGKVQYTLSGNSSLPNFLSLDSDTGYIYGYIPYQPAYTQYYDFNVNATRQMDTGSAVTSTNMFSLAIKGKVESTIEWISDSKLGTIVSGEVSELSVVARNINTNYGIKYTITSGNLPQGLNMNSDGSISGFVEYTANTGTYQFNVSASDVYGLSAIDREFELVVEQYNSKQYTQIYCKPFMNPQKREVFNSIMSDEFVFPLKMMYRPLDPNFGIQRDIKLVLEFGIEKLSLAEYLPALRENFYKRKFFFGNVKVALAKDADGIHVYDVVYMEVYDNLINENNISINHVVYANNTSYYPASVTNMKRQLRKIVLDDYSYIDVNEYNMPRYMRTAQESDYRPVGYLRSIPLCFTLPNNGKKIVSRIKLKNIDFNQFDFEIDRIIVKQSLDNSTDKYLLLDRNSISDPIGTDNYLFGPDNVRLDQENSNPITEK